MPGFLHCFPTTIDRFAGEPFRRIWIVWKPSSRAEILDESQVSIVVLQIDEFTAPAQLLRIQDAVVRAALLLGSQAPLQ